nr:MAG TPA: hypothetical protein [Caudoviricetes sp.]
MWRPSPVNGPRYTNCHYLRTSKAVTTRPATVSSLATGSHQSNAVACSHMRSVTPVTAT